MLTLTEISNIDKGSYFNKDNLVGKGVGRSVYSINDNYVVKKLMTNDLWITNRSIYNKTFKLELETTIILSCNNIAPKVVYHSRPKFKFDYYIMEKLDYTLYNMLKNKIFANEHLVKLNKIL